MSEFTSETINQSHCRLVAIHLECQIITMKVFKVKNEPFDAAKGPPGGVAIPSLDTLGMGGGSLSLRSETILIHLSQSVKQLEEISSIIIYDININSSKQELCNRISDK